MLNQNMHGFFKSFYLDGINESVLIETNNNESVVNAINSSNTLMSNIKFQNNIFPDGKVGFYNNDQLGKFLSLFKEDNLKLKFIEKDDQYSKLRLSEDNKLLVDYYLADISIFPKNKEIKKIKHWDIVFQLTKDEVSNFLKSRNALPTATLLYIGKDIFIGNEEHGSNRIVVHVDKFGNQSELDDYLKFNLDDFKSVVGTFGENITVKVSSLGLAEVSWASDKMVCKYYLTQIVSN